MEYIHLFNVGFCKICGLIFLLSGIWNFLKITDSKVLIERMYSVSLWSGGRCVLIEVISPAVVSAPLVSGYSRTITLRNGRGEG